MPAWLLPFAFTAAAMIAAPVAAKLAVTGPRAISPGLGAALEAGVTFAVVLLGLAVAGLQAGKLTLAGTLWASLAGLLWGLFTVSLYYAFSLGAPAGITMAALRALGVLGTTAFAVLALGESLSGLQATGIALIALGIVLTLGELGA